MFEQRETLTIDDETDFESELHGLDSLLQPLSIAPVAPDAPANAGFQLPRNLWVSMLTCYAVFFAAIAVATGGSGAARFAIIVSVLYTAMYFGVASIGARQAGPESKSPLEQGKMLDTWTGPMDKKAVYGQILIVPFAVAIFGVAILAIMFATGIGGQG